MNIPGTKNPSKVIHVSLLVLTISILAFLLIFSLYPKDNSYASTMTTIYASPNGSGTACTSASPCSLQSARDLVRTMTGTMTGDIVVNLKGGTYALSSPFTLDQNDSGNNGFNVIYQNAPGETPILSGGTNITGWAQFDSGKNIWKASVPNGFDTRNFWVNGTRAQRAFENLDYNAWSKIGTGFTAPNQAPYNNIGNFKNLNDVEIIGYIDWIESHCPISSVSGLNVNLSEPCWSNSSWTEGWGPDYQRKANIIENAYELLNQQGEWYLDRTGAVGGSPAIYYIPRSGENMTTASEVAGKLESIFTALGNSSTPIHNVQIKGLTFSYATWLEPNGCGFSSGQAGSYQSCNAGTPVGGPLSPANITFKYARNILLDSNTFIHLGAVGVDLQRGSQNVIVNANSFSDISGTGLQIGNVFDTFPSTQDSVDNVTASNNWVTTIGQEYKGDVGIFGGYIKNANITHNSITNVPYTGISMGWGWGEASYMANNQITYNRIDGIMQVMRDGGGIYTLSAQPNSVISNNYISHDNNQFGAIYLDQHTAGYTITNNVVESNPLPWYYMNITDYNEEIYPNFTDTSAAVCISGRCDPPNVNTSDPQAIAIKNASGPTTTLPSPSPIDSPVPSPSPIAGLPAAPTVTIPSCIANGYSGSGVTISWVNPTSPVNYVDISSDSTFTTYANKYISSGTSTSAPNGFASAQTGAAFTLNPNTTYYTRLYNGDPAGNHSDSTSFSIPSCTGSPIPSPSAMNGLPAAPTVTKPPCIANGYNGSGITISWINPASAVNYVDISSDSTFSTYANKYISTGTSTTGPNGFASAQTGAPLTLNPDTTYYTRLYNGDPAGNHSDATSFSIPSCTSSPTPSPSGSASSFLSDLGYVVVSSGHGPVEKDKSNGEDGAGDGNTLTLNGVTYSKGLGTHAYSEITYAMNGHCSNFTSNVGIDDEVAGFGSAIFQVFLDGVKAYDSGIMTGSTATNSVNVNITNQTQLKLVVTNAGDNNNYDHADWVDAKITCN